MRLLVLLTLVAGCAAQSGGGRGGAPGEATLGGYGALAVVGPRCSGGRCSCRSIDHYGRAADRSTEGNVPRGFKRFELRTGRGFDRTSITVAGRGTLEKDVTTVEPTCGYLDLAPGRHRVRARFVAKDDVQGMHPRLAIAEYGSETGDWYDTFRFECGRDQPCVTAELKSWLDEMRRVRRGIFDPCGSTRVEDIAYSVEHSSEQALTDVTIELVLNVYRFAPSAPHGSAGCRTLQGGKAAEEELAR